MRVTAIPDDTGLGLPLRNILTNGTLEYDIKKFRLFRWYPYTANAGSENKWVEYSGGNAALFSFTPGRVIWIKTDLERHIVFGAGVTTSLTEPQLIELPPRNWTDFSIPFKFNVKLADVLETTGSSSESLQFYKWQKASSGYVAQKFYISAIDSFADKKNSIQFEYAPRNDAFTVYNPLDIPVTLKIPPVPPALSTAKLHRKKAIPGSWVVKFNWATDGTEGLSSLYCGANPDSRQNQSGPVPPLFGTLRAGIANPEDSKLECGYVIMAKHETSKGYSYEIRLRNSSDKSSKITYGIECTDALPENMHAAVLNPVTMEMEPPSQLHTANVPPGGIQYRYVAVGTGEFLNNIGKSLTPFRLALDKAWPNPSRGRMSISFTIPYQGIRNIRFSIYDLNGRTVWEHKPSQPLSPGSHTIQWDGRTRNGGITASGVYILQMQAAIEGEKAPQVFKTRITHMR
jgi:hypothetical protein